MCWLGSAVKRRRLAYLFIRGLTGQLNDRMNNFPCPTCTLSHRAFYFSFNLILSHLCFFIFFSKCQDYTSEWVYQPSIQRTSTITKLWDDKREQPRIVKLLRTASGTSLLLLDLSTAKYTWPNHPTLIAEEEGHFIAVWPSSIITWRDYNKTRAHQLHLRLPSARCCSPITASAKVTVPEVFHFNIWRKCGT